MAFYQESGIRQAISRAGFSTAALRSGPECGGLAAWLDGEFVVDAAAQSRVECGRLIQMARGEIHMLIDRMIFYACLVALAPALRAPAAEGWTISATVSDLTVKPAEYYRSVMTLSGPNLRIDTSDFTGEATHLVMTTQGKSILHLNTATRTYQRVDERKAAQVGEHAEAVHGYFRKQADKWKDKPVVEAKLEIRSTGETRTILGLKCRKYEIWIGPENKERQVWIAPWSQAGLEKASFQNVRQLAVLYEKVKYLPGVTLTLADGGSVSLEGVPEIDGYPVVIEHLVKGRVVCRMQLGKPKKAAVQESAFTVPDGYKLQWF